MIYGKIKVVSAFYEEYLKTPAEGFLSSLSRDRGPSVVGDVTVLLALVS